MAKKKQVVITTEQEAALAFESASYHLLQLSDDMMIVSRYIASMFAEANVTSTASGRCPIGKDTKVIWQEIRDELAASRRRMK